MTHIQTIREQVFSLRKEGYSYKYISGKTGISKSTLSGWLSNIPYTPNKETVQRIGKARAASGYVKAKQKNESIQKATREAINDIGKVSKRDLFMLGLGIYIGEGTKSHGMVRIINADPKIIRLAVRWFTDVCGVPKENFRIRLHAYPDNNIQEAISHWSHFLKIPRDQFQKTQIDFRLNKKKSKKGKLPYGTAHLGIKSNGKKELGVFFARKIMGWVGEVLK